MTLMTYEQVIMRLRELAGQFVTKPDNEFAQMADSLQTAVDDAAMGRHGASALCCQLRMRERQRAQDLAAMIRRLLAAVQHGAMRDDKHPLYRRAFDLLTRFGLHGAPLRGDQD